MNAETILLKSILLELSNIPGVILWRNHIGFDSRAKVDYGICNPGGADLIGFYYARFLAIEVKVPGGIRSPEQINFIRIVRKYGGLAGFAESIDDAKDILNGIYHD